MSAKVTAVTPRSLAHDAGIRAGDTVLYINGREIRDILDYKFAAADEELEITVQKASGGVKTLKIYNEDYSDLGLEFDTALFDGAKRCRNKCIFCFIDQLPKGMRKTLYFKDDDSRLSFLQGNYITLTNLTRYDIDRIKEMRLSPVNISVHTTNPGLREFMLNNPKAGGALQIMREFKDANIEMNLQIVLCRGINDGAELDRSIEDLSNLFPAARSLSVVPVGLTKHREGLFELLPYDRESAGVVIEQVSGWQKRLYKKLGTRFVFAADEFFVLAGREIPAYHEYEDFLQIENGVGLMANMKEEFFEAIKAPPKKKLRANIVTGLAAEGFMKSLAKAATDRYGGEINVYAVENKFFGPHVTVTGLLTGRDIISALKGLNLKGGLILPRVMLKYGEDTFLDDLTVRDLERELSRKITVSGMGGGDLWEAINNLEE